MLSHGPWFSQSIVRFKCVGRTNRLGGSKIRKFNVSFTLDDREPIRRGSVIFSSAMARPRRRSRMEDRERTIFGQNDGLESYGRLAFRNLNRCPAQIRQKASILTGARPAGRTCSKTRVGLSRRHCSQVDATSRKRQPCTIPDRTQEFRYCSRRAVKTAQPRWTRAQRVPASSQFQRETPFRDRQSAAATPAHRVCPSRLEAGAR